MCAAADLHALDRRASTLSAAPVDANERRIAADTAAAINALGANPGTRQISSIVFKAVRSSPASVLYIVDAAVRVSPQAAATEIVIAATAGVPNPWKKVVYRRLAAVEEKKHAPDFKGGPDGKQISEGKGVHAPEDQGTEMTLAEAIAHAAFDAQPGLGMPALLAAVNVALLSDPAILLQRIGGPRVVSGVGDAGTSNYANEPLRPRVSGGSTVPVPSAPAVSQ